MCQSGGIYGLGRVHNHMDATALYHECDSSRRSITVVLREEGLNMTSPLALLSGHRFPFKVLICPMLTYDRPSMPVHTSSCLSFTVTDTRPKKMQHL